MEREDEKKSGAAGAGKKLSIKKLWWVPFAGVFLFLLAGGYYAMVSMRQSAHKLAGGDDYDRLSANSAVYDEKVAPVGNSGLFAGGEDEALSSPQPAAQAGGHLTPMLAGKSGVQSSAMEAAAAASGAASEPGASAAGGQVPATGQGAMAARLQGMGGSLGKPGGPKGQPGGAKSMGFRADGSVTGLTGVNNPLKGAGQAKTARSGVMDSLKGAFRASIYGARIASEDSAKSWTARSFDATPEASTALQYSEEMRKELDMVNPNSIPGFLRDQDISGDGARKLSASEVADPSIDKEAMKEAAKKAGEDGFAKDLFSGMMNGMFKGMGPKTKDAPDPVQPAGGDGGSGNDQMSLLSDPKSDNSNCQAGCADEFGYISYGPPGGFQTVFDANGNQMGCTDNAAGFSIPVGAPGCP